MSRASNMAHACSAGARRLRRGPGCTTKRRVARADTPSLTRLEPRLALFEESRDALAVILGVEAGVAFVPLVCPKISAHRETLDEAFVPARDERRTRRNAFGRCVGFGFDDIVGDDAIHESFFERFPRVENAAFEKNLERGCAADERQQT